MTGAQREEYKRLVRGEIAELKAEIPRLKELTRPVAPDNAIGRVSRMDNIVNQSVAKERLGVSRARLLRLEEALRRADGEDFGVCADCGDPIPMARLRALPETDLCVECAG